MGKKEGEVGEKGLGEGEDGEGSGGLPDKKRGFQHKRYGKKKEGRKYSPVTATQDERGQIKA